jgi:hypothetical protein
MDRTITVPSENILRKKFGFLESKDLNHLLEYAGLQLSVSRLSDQLKTQFPDQVDLILESILQLVPED